MVDEPVVEPQADEDLETLQPGDDGSLADILAKDREQRIADHTGIQDLPETEPEESPPVEELPKFDPKHKTWEETEKSRVEAERVMHERAEEAKRDREARETAERELAELRQKLAEQEAPVKPAKAPEELEAEKVARNEAMFEEIGELDELDPDYRKKLSKIYVKYDFGGPGQPVVPDQKVLDELIDRRVEERFRAREAEAAQHRQDENNAQIWAKAIDLAAKAGLDMESDSADEILFNALVKKVPQEYDAKPLQEQVDWVVAEVRKRTGKVVQTKEERDRLAREVQAANTVMGRGTTQPRKTVEPETFSLGGILNEIQEERKQAARSRRT